MQRKPILALSLAAALSSSSLLADELPVFRDKVLSVDAAVVFTTGGAAYYGDIRLKNNADGTFTLVQAQRRTLANIDKAEVSLNKSNPPQAVLHVSGTQVDPCAGLEKPGLVRDGNHFTVVIAETAAKPGSVCMPLVAVTPFVLDLPLSEDALPAGRYTVVVNGKVVDFVL